MIDDGVITIDLLSKNYEINDYVKAHHVSHLDSPRRSPSNHFIIRNLGPSDPQIEGPQDEYPYEPKQSLQSNPKFKLVLIVVWVNKWEKTKEAWELQGRKVGKENEKDKDVKGKSPIEKGPNLLKMV